MTDTAIQTAEATGKPTLKTGGVADYFALLKPRVMSLVVFTGMAGLSVAPGSLHPFLALVTLLCIAVGAGAAGAINMWYDRDIDAVMARTQRRPLPQGRMDPTDALAFGIVLSVGAVVLMGLAVNWMAAGILALANAFYVFVYTMWLKRRTPQNIVIGGAAGAFPPMIGWVAVTGNVSLGAVMLFLLIFFWTPPHFWALALFRNSDYQRAGVPMLPVVAGERATKWQMLAYTIVLLPVSISPHFFGVGGMAYVVGAVILSLVFIGCAIRVLRDSTHRSAKQMFAYSIIYLFLLFAILMGEKLVAAATV